MYGNCAVERVWTPGGVEVLWIHTCPSVRPFVCNQFLLELADKFFLKFCTTIKIEKQKNGKCRFSKIFLVCPKISKNCPKRVQNRDFLSFLENLLLFFVGDMLNWKIFQFFIFLFKLHIWKMLLVKLHARSFYPLRLLDSLIINISGRKASISLIFLYEYIH